MVIGIIGENCTGKSTLANEINTNGCDRVIINFFISLQQFTDVNRFNSIKIKKGLFLIL